MAETPKTPKINVEEAFKTYSEKAKSYVNDPQKFTKLVDDAAARVQEWSAKAAPAARDAAAAAKETAKAGAKEAAGVAEALGDMLPEAVSTALKDLADLIALARTYIAGEYTQLPTQSIIALAAGLLYVVAPLDLIPDFIPLFGIVDDAAIVAFVVTMIHDDVEQFRAWRAANPTVAANANASASTSASNGEQDASANTLELLEADAYEIDEEPETK